MGNYLAFYPLDTYCENATDITVFIMDWEGAEKVSPPRTCFTHCYNSDWKLHPEEMNECQKTALGQWHLRG